MYHILEKEPHFKDFAYPATPWKVSEICCNFVIRGIGVVGSCSLNALLYKTDLTHEYLLILNSNFLSLTFIISFSVVGFFTHSAPCYFVLSYQARQQGHKLIDITQNRLLLRQQKQRKYNF